MKLKWDTLLPIWWSFAWRAFVYGALAGAAGGFIAGLVGPALGIPAGQGSALGAGAGLVAGWIASIPALKHALEKHLATLGAANLTERSGT